MKPNDIRILMIRSNPIQPDPRVEKGAKTLSDANYAVEVLAWDRDGESPVHEHRDGYIIHRLKIKAKYGSGLKNIFKFIHWQLSIFYWILKNANRYDVYHACDFDTVLPAYFGKIIFRKILIYEIFDFYADHIRNAGSRLKSLLRKIELFICSKSDGVIIADELRKDQLQHTPIENLVVILNTPPDLSSELETVDPQSQYDLNIIYVGILQKERGLLTLIDILKDHKNWHLDLGGFGGDEEEVTAEAQKLPNITFHGRIPYKKTLQLSANADLLFALYDPTVPNHKFASPNKLFEAMMLGKPILVAENTNIDKLVRNLEIGLVVDYFSTTDIETALQKLSRNPTLQMELSANSRKAYEETYNWHIMEKRLLDFYSTVLAPN